MDRGKLEPNQGEGHTSEGGADCAPLEVVRMGVHVIARCEQLAGVCAQTAPGVSRP